ncbi:UbiD family decarboxylase [Aeropyrum camini]|uniref:Anhydromevalonate phosphate decarboxylase n=1 Tax=Aeropyrum camini SY1 = JCM 12091 TaxID=1198449 RepID=U3THF9_9CREN|nr:UbiD family decarboxylase [Aeropyrum camini]BAN90769.1 3-polyprenyl-4-hydroxybenzoate decarboxylase [Aeropyrum camini SY1 = JCM 12091]
MEDASLKSFLENVGYKYVDKTLSRDYQVARLIAETQGCGPALLARIEGVRQPVAINIVDTREKLYKALGVSADQDAYARIIASSTSPGRLEHVDSPPLEELPEGFEGLPAAKFYEGEAGQYLSSGIVIACYEGVCNASIHRLLILGRDKAAIRIVPRHLWHLYRRARDAGEDLPATIIVGVHPAVLLAAATSPPLGVFELGVAAGMLGGSMKVYKSPVHGNPVPLGAAMVADVWITGELVEEGPYVDALLTYDRVRRQPVVRLERAYYREGEYTHTIMGGSLEHVNLMGFPREASIWEAVRRAIPRVRAVRLTPASGGWLHAVIAIEKQHDGDGKTAIMAAFAAHPSLKHVVVVDGDVDVDDPMQVEWAIATRFQADKDLVVIPRARGSTLDPSAADGLTAKMGLDATKPLNANTGYKRGRIPGFKWGSTRCP